MTFIFRGKRYVGTSAARIVRALMNDAPEYRTAARQNRSVKDFLGWSLARFDDCVHPRELDASGRVSDETLAYSYLCLLDEHDLGKLFDTARISA
jgi:hypothetical protein